MSEVFASDLCALISLSNFFAIPRPFHPPRKNLASAPARAPAYQKIACILVQQFWQSPSPSTHPVKIWQALPRWHFWFPGLCIHPVFLKFGERYREGTCVSENCDHFFYNFCNPSASSERYRGGTCVSENCIHLVSKILAVPQPFVSKNCMHFISNLFAIPKPLHPPRKNLASATAGAPACQKIACILFPKFY